MRDGLQLLPASLRREQEESWVTRLEEEERKLLEARRQELMQDPHQHDIMEHLLEMETTADKP